MSDYLYWDDSDVDLSEMLGEWTEYELDFSSDSWSEEESNSSKRPKTETDTSAKPTLKTYSYKCPICLKQYLSISGFRGHVVNKHKRCDLKASQHKLSDTEKADVAAASACNQGITKTSSDIITFTDNSFTHLLEAAVLEVLNNPNHNSNKSKFGSTMVHIGKIVMSSPDMMQELGTVLKPPFLDTLAVFGKANSFSADTELMWSKFHSMRTNFEQCARLRSVVLKVANETEMHVLFFIQCLLDDVIRCAITNFTSSLQKETEKSVESFTGEDNSVLFYISGYLIYAMEKKSMKKRSTASASILKNLCASSTQKSPDFVTKVKRWTVKVNGGGLKVCGDNFFFLVRKIETICRLSVNLKGLNRDAIAKMALKEAIMQDITVGFYWDKLIASDDKIKTPILENIVDLFLRLRGRAVAKHVQRQSQKENAKASLKGKKSQSLRKRL